MEPFERLQKARTDAGLRSAREAAERFGWTYSTYASHENGGRGINLHAARKYARAFGVKALWIMGGEDGGPAVRDFAPVPLARVIGEVAAGLWLEEDSDLSHSDVLVPSAPNYPPEHQMAYRVRGPSINKVIPDGDYAIGVWLESARPVRDGDLVVVRRTRAGLVETSIKRYRGYGDSAQLMPESDDPKFKDPIPLGSVEDDTRVEIVALIIGSYRPLL